MSAVELFQYESTQLRSVILDGEPWFVAADVAKILEYSATSAMTRRLDEDDKGVRRLHTLGGEQEFAMISEAGFYAAVLGSQSSNARTVKRWLSHEVLPTIRKTGGYTTVPELSEDEVIHRALTITAKRVEVLTEKVAELEPKAEFYDELMDSNGCYSMLAASKMIGWGRNVMMRDLRRMGVLQGNNLPYQRYEHHFKVVPGTYVNRKTGETVPTATVYVLPKGVEFLRQKLAKAPSVVAS